jgi:phospholipid transport system substrate-binding protein
MRVFLTVLTLLFSLNSLAGNAPEVVVKTAADKLLSQILANKSKVESDPKYVASLVEDNLIDIVDQDRMAKLALGKYWKDTSDKQKADFIRGFKLLLIKTYAGAFKAYNGQPITYSATRYNDSKDKAIVETQIQQPGGQNIDLQYRMSLNNGEWKVFDAVVAGLGLVQTYRTQFAEQIQRDGLDNTIAQLNATQL